MRADPFDNLIVLELANNHWGSVPRGLRIIAEFSDILRSHKVRGAIKLQFRDAQNLIHKEWRSHADIRYIGKTLATQLTSAEHALLVEAIRERGCLPVATPFDEKSVEFCAHLELPIIKLASSSTSDWPLIEAVLATRRPVICSAGGASLDELSELVARFENEAVPLAINHCVSQYPCEDKDLELDQIDVLRRRYSGHTIGFSTHEYHDWETSMHIAYAKGARMFERHIDINADDKPVSLYCSLPHQIDAWLMAFEKTREMCGGGLAEERVPKAEEVAYLRTLMRGVYAQRPLSVGCTRSSNSLTADVYLAVPLQSGQLSSGKLRDGGMLLRALSADQPVMKADISRG